MFGSFLEEKLANLYPYPTCAPSLNFGVIIAFCGLEIVSFFKTSYKGVPKENETKKTNKLKRNGFFNLLKCGIMVCFFEFGENMRNFKFILCNTESTEETRSYTEFFLPFPKTYRNLIGIKTSGITVIFADYFR